MAFWRVVSVGMAVPDAAGLKPLVDPQVEALGVGVSPHGSDRLPELAFAVTA
jgi:hypothetical protein